MSPQDFKGAPRIVLTEISNFLNRGQNPSYHDLVIATGYAYSTIYRAIKTLEKAEAIRITRNGTCKLEYEILSDQGI